MGGAALRFGVIGVGGYASAYLSSLEFITKRGDGVFAAAVIRSPQKYAEKVGALEKEGVRIYPTTEAMLAAEKLDVLGVPTGISSHVPLTIQGMKAGCDVICEKPLCATVQEAAELMRERERMSRRVAIGYQRMYSPQTQEIKRRIIDGPLGKVLRARVKASWPRTQAYYDRNSWAGKVKDSDGRWVLDSPVNNALAHYLQHVLFLAGAKQLASAEPRRVQAELYRARDIENFDTCAIRIKTSGGADILYVVSHATLDNWGPTIEVECEGGSVLWDRDKGTLITMKDGATDPVEVEKRAPDERDLIFLNMVESKRDGVPLLCTPYNSVQQTLVINAAQDATPVRTVPAKIVETVEGKEYGKPAKFTRVKGLEKAISRCYDEWKTFSELGLEWASPGGSLDVAGYEAFRGDKV